MPATLDAFIIDHVGATAIVQLDGGLLTVDDPNHQLAPNRRAVVTASGAGETIPPFELSLGRFTAEQVPSKPGAYPYTLTLLRPLTGGSPIPLLLTPGQQLPSAAFDLTIRPGAEDADHVEGGGADPDESKPVGEFCSPCSHPLHIYPDELAAIMSGRRCP